MSQQRISIQDTAAPPPTMTARADAAEASPTTPALMTEQARREPADRRSGPAAEAGGRRSQHDWRTHRRRLPGSSRPRAGPTRSSTDLSSWTSQSLADC